MTDNITKGSLLLVDDEINILKSLQRILANENYQVFIATNGEEGLNLLATHPVDVIISDMRMPIMDGAAFLKIAADRWPDTKRLLLTGYTDINAAVSAINEGKIDYYLTKPWNNEHILKTIARMFENKHLRDKNREYQLLISQQNEELKILNNNLEEKVHARTAELHTAYARLQASYTSATEVLLSIVEMHEGPLKGHCRRIAEHAKLLAIALKLPDNEIQEIYLAAMLYNLGKLGLPEKLSSKPITTLTPAELLEFKQYPILGGTVLLGFEPLKNVATIILAHRERFDGGGFPNRISGDTIPLHARIISLAIDYSELQAGLVYPERLLANFAMNEIESRSNTYYDPTLVKLFIDVIKKLPNKEQTATAELLLQARQLTPGMILSRDLVSKHGMILLPKGKKLSADLIDKVKSLDSLKIYVSHH